MGLKIAENSNIAGLGKPSLGCPACLGVTPVPPVRGRSLRQPLIKASPSRNFTVHSQVMPRRSPAGSTMTRSGSYAKCGPGFIQINAGTKLERCAPIKEEKKVENVVTPSGTSSTALPTSITVPAVTTMISVPAAVVTVASPVKIDPIVKPEPAPEPVKTVAPASSGGTVFTPQALTDESQVAPVVQQLGPEIDWLALVKNPLVLGGLAIVTLGGGYLLFRKKK